MNRTFYIPEPIDSNLHNLTLVTQETIGILPYQIQPNGDCLIDGIFMTGIGSIDQVTADFQRKEIVKEFLRRNRTYRPVMLHTHTARGIAETDPVNATDFSPEDYKRMYRSLALAPDTYVAMVETPKARVMFGNNINDIVVIPDEQLYKERRNWFQNQIAQIARELGVKLTPLRGSTIY